MYFAGIDIGSTVTKIVIINEYEEICSLGIGPTGAEHRSFAGKVMNETLSQAGLSMDEILSVIATGYGRINVPFADTQVTELTCHAKGVFSIFPNVGTAIDIGGQDAKGMKIKKGKLVDFVMNDKCAAGTGRFLEVTADTLGINIERFGEISMQSTDRLKISSTCTVFAQQEMISYISQGVPVENILAGLHDAICSRVARMVHRLKIEPDIVLTGGVARNIGVVKAMKGKLGSEIFVPEDPIITGALGAALLGKESTMKAIEKGEVIQIKRRELDGCKK